MVVNNDTKFITFKCNVNNDIHLSDLEIIYNSLLNLNIFDKGKTCNDNSVKINLSEYSQNYQCSVEIIYRTKGDYHKYHQFITLKNNVDSYFYGELDQDISNEWLHAKADLIDYTIQNTMEGEFYYFSIVLHKVKLITCAPNNSNTSANNYYIDSDTDYHD